MKDERLPKWHPLWARCRFCGAKRFKECRELGNERGIATVAMDARLEGKYQIATRLRRQLKFHGIRKADARKPMILKPYSVF